MTAQDTTRPAYDAARQGAAVLPRLDTTCLDVTGADRVAWLQGLVTNDVAALAPGQGCYAALLTPQGRMLADLRVLVHPEAVWLDVPAGVAATLRERLEAFIITEDVALHDRSGDRARIGIHGPQAARTVAAAFVEAGPHREACAAALDRLVPFAHETRPWHGDEVVVAGNDDLAVPGFDVYVAAGRAGDVVGRLLAAGAVLANEATWHVLRVEAGRPAWGHDLHEDVIPLEAGLEDRAISFTKGCYVGQEIIVRVRDRGQGRVARRLMGLVAVEADAGPAAAFAPGEVIVAGGREAGRVTSAAWSPALGRSIGLGYVQRAVAIEGEVVEVRGMTGAVAVRLQTGPLVGGPAS